MRYIDIPSLLTCDALRAVFDDVDRRIAHHRGVRFRFHFPGHHCRRNKLRTNSCSGSDEHEVQEAEGWEGLRNGKTEEVD